MTNNLLFRDVPSSKEVCVCIKKNRPHFVSRATWHKHYQAATTEERERLRIARLFREEVPRLQPTRNITNAAALNPSAISGKRAASDDTNPDRRRKRAKHDKPDGTLQLVVPIQPNQHVTPPPDSDDLDPPRPEQLDPPPPSELDMVQPLEARPCPPNCQIRIPRRPRPNIDLEGLSALAVLPEIKHSIAYIRAIRRASLDDKELKMTAAAIRRLRNPPNSRLQIHSGGVRHSICIYLALEHSSQDTFAAVCRSSTLNFSDLAATKGILSYEATESIIAQYTGVESIEHDMCPNTCIAYTGPFSDLDECPHCSTSCWHEGKAARKFVTIPVGPQLQAHHRDPQSAEGMRYLHRHQDRHPSVIYPCMILHM